MDVLYLGNDYLVSIPALTDSAGAPITDASVEATLLERDSLSPVSGISWPIALAHEADGNYVGIIDKAVGVVKNEKYVLRITATAGTADAQWDRELFCAWRP